jgi:hypothetical protein
MSEMLHSLICIKRKICVKGKRENAKSERKQREIGTVFILLIMAQYQLEINVHS